MTASNIKTMQFKQGDMLFRERSLGDSFYIIKEGSVEVYKTSRDKTKIPLAVLGAGQCVGEFAVLDGGLRSASAQALTKLTALQIDATSVHQQLNTMPGWFITITRSLVERLRCANELLRRNGIVDDQLMSTIKAVGDSYLRQLEAEEKQAAAGFLQKK